MGERDELWVRVLTSGGPDNDGPAKWYTLTALAAALRPLLAQPEQPAAAADATAADTAALQARVAELEAAAEAIAHDLRTARAERDWARNARDNANRTVDTLREQLVAANRQLDKAAANVQQADAAKQRAELRAADMADTIAAQVATIARLTMERDELAAKWAAIPWAALGYWMPRTGDSMARDWFNANRPAVTD